jgi:hypothetical protein
MKYALGIGVTARSLGDTGDCFRIIAAEKVEQ